MSDTLSLKHALAQETKRNTCSILGLPFDVLNMDDAVAQVYSSIDNNIPCFISTPNLNFLMACQTDMAFRQSVINSDLSLADGMPLVWIARLLRLPIRDRVAGSGLFEALMNARSRAENPVKVFFFGGQEGVAEQASRKLNQQPGGVQCVGVLNPGFGSIEDMSQPHIIEAINRSGAEFIVVSLGAKKGQAWIEHNRQRLDAPVISHLGAVVNFVAGTVKRAPLFWQRCGLEWLWRIKEEPSLWQRYFFDGFGFLKLLITRVFPYALIVYSNQKKAAASIPVSVKVHEKPGEVIITLGGALVSENLELVRDEFSKLACENENIVIDLNAVEYVDASFVGSLLILYKHVGVRMRLVDASASVKKILDYNGASFLL